MGQYMRDLMNRMEAIEEGKNISEATISDPLVDRIAGYMVYAQRVEAPLTNAGVDLEAFKTELIPAMKVIFAKMGINVQGASAAKKDVRSSAR
jgi:predicted aminopeptidase